jgi:hypothetical protein
MQCQLHSALAATWILGAGVVGLVGNVTSIGGATMVLGLGLVPPMLVTLLVLRWRDPVHAVPVRQAHP